MTVRRGSGRRPGDVAAKAARPARVKQGAVKLGASVIVVVAVLGTACAAGSTRNDQLTISMLASSTQQPGYGVLISNFERAYPNFSVSVTYATTAARNQLELTELAAGNAPDLLATNAGCGSAIAVCALAEAGDLAPLVNEPWAKRSLPAVISFDKHGQGLFAFTPIVAPFGMFTNDPLFAKLGLKVPQTFSQLLTLCQRAKADGTAAVLLPGADTTDVPFLIMGLAVATLYGGDPHWTAELKAEQSTFAGTDGWQQALQHFIDMNNAGCFQPGATQATSASAEAEFAQGQGLMVPLESSLKGSIDLDDPQFAYSFHALPAGNTASAITTWLAPGPGVSVNGHSSPQNQAAAHAFIDFVGRPKQNALYAQTQGGLTQYEFLKGQIPAFMSSLGQVFARRRYVLLPDLG